MYCPNCGKEIPDDSTFCEFCGSRIEEGAGGKVHTDFGEDDIASSANGKNASGGSSKNLETNPVVIGVLVLAIVVLTSGFILVRSGKGKADKASADETMQTAADSGNAGEITGGDEVKESSGENTAESASSGSVPQNTGDAYTPETYAISGGKWDVLQSGEIVYTQSNGTSVQNAWVENKGKYLYVDFTGCLMKNNYTADGFWVGDDGAWDNTKERRTDDAKPLSGAAYGTDPKLEIEILDYSDGSTYAKAKRTYSFGYAEEFNVMPLGCSTYLLEGKDDFNSGFLMVVSRDQKTLTLSGVGETTEYVMQ